MENPVAEKEPAAISGPEDSEDASVAIHFFQDLTSIVLVPLLLGK